RNHHTLIGGRKIENLLARLLVVHNRSDWNLEQYVFALAAALVRAFAVASALRLVFGIEAEMHQRVMALAGFHNHVAAIAAVAARRPAAWNIFLATEGHAAIAAVTGLDPNFRFINEHGLDEHGSDEHALDEHGLAKAQNKKPRPEGEAAWRGRPARDCRRRTRNYSATSMGSTITNLPIEPLFRNLMRPVILANKVSSLPRPTFSPGFTRVPRCRTMMVPPGTICPPNALNPSRCAFESRPFREVPCPFLCAIIQLSILKVAPASRRLLQGNLPSQSIS